ncbi:MAG: M23 family metallopeptidase, partial [Micromonosporaceae bacterium]|nr:M23 family metallopeptidase [Micromonosporaceae bacterium]
AQPAASSRAPDRTRPAAVRYVFPVVGKASYSHTHHDYPATDIITACGNRVLAATTGVVLEVTRVDTWSAAVNAGATRGGLSVSILGTDGVRYYGSHLEAIDPGIAPGVRVSAGQPLGRVGRTGDASACHLHFGISPPCAQRGDWWNQRGVVWPWRYLDSWRRNGSLSAVAEVAAWHAAHGCPTHPLVDP